MKPLVAAYRYPDIPSAVTPSALDGLVAGDWLAQLKFNGFRCMYEWDGMSLSLWGRKKRQLSEPSHEFRSQVYTLFRSLDLPPCVIDGEWMGRRGGQPERAWFFDLLATDGAGLAAGAWERLDRLYEVMPQEDLIVPWTTAKEWEKRVRPPQPYDSPTPYRNFYDHAKGWRDRGCEGIVLKRADSKFFGKMNDCYANPAWLKCKYIGGEDGQKPLEIA